MGHNRITNYYNNLDARGRLQKAERDLRFMEAMLQLGFEYSTEAERIVSIAAKQRAAAMAELKRK